MEDEYSSESSSLLLSSLPALYPCSREIAEIEINYALWPVYISFRSGSSSAVLSRELCILCTLFRLNASVMETNELFPDARCLT